MVFLEILLFITSFFFLKLTNIFTIWYVAGLYLLFLGLFSLCLNGGIFIGFLWIIDFGVGLICFIFILHFSNFLYQKTLINFFDKYFSFFFLSIILSFFIFIFIFNTVNFYFNLLLNKSWFFFLSWYNFYNIFAQNQVSNLNLLKEIYFFNNSYEFFVINFMIFYGILTAILLSFSLKNIFNNFSLFQFKNLFTFKKSFSIFFIRNQNFVKQQQTSTASRLWNKKKSKN